MTSPTSAVMLEGEKNSLLGPPTITTCSRGLSAEELAEGALVELEVATEDVVKEVMNPEDVAA